MRKLLSMVMVAGLVACQRTPEVQPRPLRDIGEFDYKIQVGKIPVEGGFSIESDTVVLDAANHSCKRLDTALRDRPYTHSFSCGGGPIFFNVVINSKDPALSRWSSSESTWRVDTICTQSRTDKDGNVICTATRRETVTVTTPISGRLHITRVASTDRQ